MEAIIEAVVRGVTSAVVVTVMRMVGMGLTVVDVGFRVDRGRRRRRGVRLHRYSLDRASNEIISKCKAIS